MSTRPDVIVLTRSEVEQLLDLEACIKAVEHGFRSLVDGRAGAPRVMGVPVEGGGFHVKAGVLGGERSYFAAKVNGNFPSNPVRRGLPTVQGTIVLCDAANGCQLAVMDATAITTLRTGAATALAARYLARSDSGVATIVGCGVQGRIQLEALRSVLPIMRVLAFDRDGCRADSLVADWEELAGFEVRVAGDLRAALAVSDVVVTCTPSHEPLMGPGDVKPGTFIAAVGADHPEKQEIDPRLMASCTVVVDDLEQCATVGDLHHAIEVGAMSREDVHATLGDLVAGVRPGRTREDEITLFDSTGIAVQDVASAAVVFERATLRGVGIRLPLVA